MFPVLSGQGSEMLKPGGNLERRALHDQGVIRQIDRLVCGREGRVALAEQKGLWKVSFLMRRGMYSNFLAIRKTAYLLCLTAVHHCGH